MKKWITGAAMVALAVGYSQRADASILVDISVGATHLTCDNGTAGGVTTCTANGFTTSVGSQNVGWGGAFGNLSIGGYTFMGTSGVNDNVPGSPTIAQASDSKLSLINNSATQDLNVLFVAYGFTSPSGSGLSFSASDTGNFTSTGSTATGNYTSWADNTNGKVSGVGVGVTTPVCNTSGGTTTSCKADSGNAAFSTVGSNPYSLVGLESIHLAIGDQASFQGTEVVSAVPEPMTFSLMGAGLLGLGLLRKRIGRS